MFYLQPRGTLDSGFPNTYQRQTWTLLASESTEWIFKLNYLAMLLQILLQELWDGPRNLCFTKFPRCSVMSPEAGKSRSLQSGMFSSCLLQRQAVCFWDRTQTWIPAPDNLPRSTVNSLSFKTSPFPSIMTFLEAYFLCLSNPQPLNLYSYRKSSWLASTYSLISDIHRWSLKKKGNILLKSMIQ